MNLLDSLLHLTEKWGLVFPQERSRQAYLQERKKNNLSVQFVALVQEVRQRLNLTGHADKPLCVVADGSFSNRTIDAQDWSAQNVSVVTRTRKDIRLCGRAPGRGQRVYGKTKFTPEQVRRRGSLARWQSAPIFHGGVACEVRYKEMRQIDWQGGARRRPVRLLVVEPVGYRTTKNGRKSYRQPAYLLTTDLNTAAAVLLQAYFGRWGSEVNHRDEQQILGVGEAQMWNPQSVRQVPARPSPHFGPLRMANLQGATGRAGPGDESPRAKNADESAQSMTLGDRLDPWGRIAAFPIDPRGLFSR